MSGKLIVISASSGAGKTSIAGEILRTHPNLQFSISATTRKKRPGEQEGKDYFFLDRGEFERKVAAGDFVEWEEFYGDCYGTLKAEVDRARDNDKHLLFDVDVKGGLSIKRQYPDALLIFIRPPDVSTLLERLRNRHTEDEATVQRRMARVPMELERGKEFDYQVVNDDLARAIREVRSIVEYHLLT